MHYLKAASALMELGHILSVKIWDGRRTGTVFPVQVGFMKDGEVKQNKKSAPRFCLSGAER